MNYGWIFEKCFEIKNEIIAYRRALHSIAEVRFETQKTQEFIACELEKMGLSPRFLGGGIVCEIHGTKDNAPSPFTNIDGKYSGEVTRDNKINTKKEKCVLLRADIDALPICEATNLPFAAKNGNMHACGHDVHAASLLGAALVLSESKEAFGGTVKLVFQSAEEILSGAKKMINAGVLENPKVDFCVAIHAVVGTELETGTSIVPSGGMSAPYADFFKITVVGKGGHGAVPKESKNAASAGAAIAVSLDELAKQEKKESSLSVCQIISGNAPNVIPEACEIHGTVRSLSPEARETVICKMKEICTSATLSHGCTSKLEITSSASALFCNENLAKSAEECLKSAYKSPKNPTNATVVGAPKSKLKASTPSEDFAEFAIRTPSLLIGLCAGKKSDGYPHPLHSPFTTFDESALPFGAAIYSSLALCFLEDSPIKATVKKL